MNRNRGTDTADRLQTECVDLSYLEHVPLDDRPPRVLQSFLPVFEPRLVFLILAPAKLDLSNGVSASNQVVITHLNTQSSDCLALSCRIKIASGVF